MNSYCAFALKGLLPLQASARETNIDTISTGASERGEQLSPPALDLQMFNRDGVGFAYIQICEKKQTFTSKSAFSISTSGLAG